MWRGTETTRTAAWWGAPESLRALSARKRTHYRTQTRQGPRHTLATQLIQRLRTLDTREKLPLAMTSHIPEPSPAAPAPTVTGQEPTKRVVIRFAGDSGDGMQLTGDRFTAESALQGNDLATLPNFPAEIRAPQGTLHGVSSFQIQFADHDVFTPGSAPDVLVAMNPAAFKANIGDVKPGGVVIANSSDFTPRNLRKVGYETTPLDDAAITETYTVHAVELTGLTVTAVEHLDLGRKDAERAKNMFALGLVSWMYSRSLASTEAFLAAKFAKNPTVLDANMAALKAGWAYGETTETFAHQYVVAPAPSPTGTYRNITGNTALAYGLVAAAHQAGLPLALGSYPITPASDILHTLARLKHFGVYTMQAEDEIAAAGMALGASYGGALGVTSTSGPGLSLKMETIALGISLELPLVVVNVQRGGPSTGLPTKTEQADLLQSLFGRNGEAPVPVIAAQSPSDCFDAALDAARIAVTYRTPVILLSDGYIANGSEPWRIPAVASLPTFSPDFADASHDDAYYRGPDGEFWPFARTPDTLARPWALPGTAGLEHRIGGIEKANLTGDISYDPDNHHLMVTTRAAKISGITVPDVEVDDPTGDAKVLVIGWGSTHGPIAAATRRVRETGRRVARTHVRHLNPLPANLGDVVRHYRTVVVPEMNLGQFRTILRATYLVDAQGFNQVRGLPFDPAELAGELAAHVDATTATSQAPTPQTATTKAPA